ncbi:MAG: amidase family protein, partial [Pseudomonadota bacterium]
IREGAAEPARIRVVTAASLFDGHDAAINIMRRLLQAQGAEVIHLGHDRSVDEIVEAAIAEIEAAGAKTMPVQLPHLKYGVDAYYVIATAEASSNLARFDGIRYGRRAEINKDEPLETLYARSRAEGFGPEVQRRIIIGTYALSSGYLDAYYTTALKVRRLIKQDFDDAFHT